MSKKSEFKPLAAALGTTFAVTLAISPVANAADNPFSMTQYENGYMVAEGKCGEGKCGESKGEEGKCGEGKCGEDKGGEGKCGEGKCGEDKGGEGKCGEGKCGS